MSVPFRSIGNTIVIVAASSDLYNLESPKDLCRNKEWHAPPLIEVADASIVQLRFRQGADSEAEDLTVAVTIVALIDETIVSADCDANTEVDVGPWILASESLDYRLVVRVLKLS